MHKAPSQNFKLNLKNQNSGKFWPAHPKQAPLLLFTLVLMNAICPEKAHAYLDPGTGSMILQVIIAAIAGIGCTFKIWGQKLANFIKRGKNGKQ